MIGLLSLELRDKSMPSSKIYLPTQLADRNVTETQFSIWAEELEVYLALEEEFSQFISDGLYSTL